jgi:hypothetical protein
MSRSLLLGYNPPPYQARTKLEAANYRTWQFLQLRRLVDDQTLRIRLAQSGQDLVLGHL